MATDLERRAAVRVGGSRTLWPSLFHTNRAPQLNRQIEELPNTVFFSYFFFGVYMPRP